jgi:hypothetical protein
VNPHLMYIWCNIYLFIYLCAGLAAASRLWRTALTEADLRQASAAGIFRRRTSPMRAPNVAHVRQDIFLLSYLTLEKLAIDACVTIGTNMFRGQPSSTICVHL